MKKKIIILIGAIALCIIGIVVTLSLKNRETNLISQTDNLQDTVVKSGLLVDNLEQFSVTNEQLENSDILSKAILNRVKCNFENVTCNETTGTADVIISYPDMRIIIMESMKKAEQNPEEIDKNYDGENAMEKLQKSIVSDINNAELSNTTVSVELLKNDNEKWIVVMNEDLSDALTGYIEDAYLQIYDSLEE